MTLTKPWDKHMTVAYAKLKNHKSTKRVAAMLLIISIQLTRYDTIRYWTASHVLGNPVNRSH